VAQDVFIPLTDDLLVHHPELRSARLVPYQPGVTIWRVVEIDDEQPKARRANGEEVRRRVSAGA